MPTDVFLTTWLKDKRLKHTVERATLRKGRADARPPHHHHLRARTKDRPPTASSTSCTTTRRERRDHFAARSMDLLVCDLPYGVQHGSRPEPDALDRGPERLLRERPAGVARPAAARGGGRLAWNRRMLPRPRLAELVARRGLRAAAPPTTTRFVHRVDRSITRDVLVVARPA